MGEHRHQRPAATGVSPESFTRLHRRSRWSYGWALVILGIVAVACGSDADFEAGDSGSGEVSGTVLVFAAASLTDAFGDLSDAFEAAYPGTTVELNLGGSSALREQILEGAPADVFASANESNMTQVVDAEAHGSEPVIFVRNMLQIVVPAGNRAGVTGLEAFGDESLLIGLCAQGVPCGDFGREILANAGITPAQDTDEPDVRALLTKVAADELDAGIVYVTDVTAAGDEVEGIDIPAEHNVEARYRIATLDASPNPAAAAAFVDFVLSEEGQAILTSYGFAPAGN